jgi:hypothetical protein
MPSEKYTILVCDQWFSFTRDQLQVEPGNYFETYFLGNFQEAAHAFKHIYGDTTRSPFQIPLYHSTCRRRKVLSRTYLTTPNSLG